MQAYTPHPKADSRLLFVGSKIPIYTHYAGKYLIYFVCNYIISYRFKNINRNFCKMKNKFSKRKMRSQINENALKSKDFLLFYDLQTFFKAYEIKNSSIACDTITRNVDFFSFNSIRSFVFFLLII